MALLKNTVLNWSEPGLSSAGFIHKLLAALGTFLDMSKEEDSDWLRVTERNGCKRVTLLNARENRQTS